MTRQFPDEVRYQDRQYAITAVDGTGLFDPGTHGIQPGPLSTACYRGFVSSYLIEDDRLVLDALELGRDEDPPVLHELFGVTPRLADETAIHRTAICYERLAAPVEFTGRLLLGAEYLHLGYLNMGFLPAWLYEWVQELTFDGGQLTAAYDRSAEVSAVRRRIGEEGLRPPEGMPVREWIEQTFSLTFDYSWPGTV
jgi:hypothetical protein